MAITEAVHLVFGFSGVDFNVPDDLDDYWKDIRPGYRGGRGRSVYLVGNTFGRLKVIERDGSDKHGSSTWKCQCECGNEKIVARGALIQGRVKSCGCLLAEYRGTSKQYLIDKAQKSARERAARGDDDDDDYERRRWDGESEHPDDDVGF